MCGLLSTRRKKKMGESERWSICGSGPAEASIYSPDDRPKIGLHFVVTKQDLMSSGITMEIAIAGAQEVRPTIVEEWEGRVGEQKQTIQVAYTWRGEYRAQRPARA